MAKMPTVTINVDGLPIVAELKAENAKLRELLIKYQYEPQKGHPCPGCGGWGVRCNDCNTCPYCNCDPGCELAEALKVCGYEPDVLRSPKK